MMRPLISYACLFFVVMLIGCSGSAGRAKVYPAKGTVTIDGKAVGPSLIVLQPESLGPKSPPAAGAVATDGSFRLKTYGNDDGVAEGKYSVSLSSDATAMVPVPATKPLTIEIKRDGSGHIAALDIKLESKSGAKPNIGAALPGEGGAAAAPPAGAMVPRPAP